VHLTAVKVKLYQWRRILPANARVDKLFCQGRLRNGEKIRWLKVKGVTLEEGHEAISFILQENRNQELDHSLEFLYRLDLLPRLFVRFRLAHCDRKNATIALQYFHFMLQESDKEKYSKTQGIQKGIKYRSPLLNYKL